MGVLIVGILLTLTNCEKEDLVQDESSVKLSQKKDSNIDRIQKNFSLKNYQDNFVKENLQVKWNQFDFYTGSHNSTIYEFVTNLNSKISPTKGKKSFFSKYKVQVIIDTEGNLSYTIIKYLSNEKEPLKKITINSLNGFSGTISYFNNNGEVLKLQGYSKGTFVEEFDKQSNKNISAREAPIESGTWVPMTIERWTDWYQNFLGGSAMFYSHSSDYTVSVEWVYIETGGSGYSNTIYHSHTDAPHGSGTYPDPDSIDNHAEEILIENLDPCSKSIFILIQNGNSLRDIINQFAGEDSQFSWTIETNDGSSFENQNNLAETNWSNATGNEYLTEIKSSYINSATRLSIARTIIHEAIHAYILSFLDSGVSSFTTIFPELWNDLVSRKYGDPNTPSGWNLYHHQEMARNYVNTISDALANWDGNQHNSQYYTDLAWGGLIETQIFNETSDLTDSDRIRIAESNKAEDLNNSTALGTPCN